jgi:hypothetical protein
MMEEWNHPKTQFLSDLHTARRLIRASGMRQLVEANEENLPNAIRRGLAAIPEHSTEYDGMNLNDIVF